MDPSALTESQVVLGISLIVAVATACQLAAPRLHVPALVTPESLVPLLVPAIATAAILILVARPAMALLVTIGSGLTWRERLFVGWMAPRGIVAAATAASIGATLVTLKIGGAEDLLPATFTIITVTVVYGLTALPMARALRVREVDEAADQP